MADRLADAVSPYLRSHAGNPVDWYPWGEAAFAEARARDVPVLVSIGYATCHWCHVMARESFGDPDLAASLNARFVAIKVDREEHPEVDAALLAAAGAFTQHLGWPLNVFVTPEGRAFHAGTYSPPRPVAGQPSFRQVLDAVAEAWNERRGEVEASAAGLAAALEQAVADAPPVSPVTPEALARVVDELAGFEDRQHGGFGGGPRSSPSRRCWSPRSRSAGRRCSTRSAGLRPRASPDARSSRCATAASATRSRAASSATPSAATGPSRTTSGCSPTTRCCSARTPRSATARPRPASSASCATCCAGRAVRSGRRRTPRA